MKIKRFRLTIEPHPMAGSIHEMRIEVISNGKTVVLNETCFVNDFESKFEWMLKTAKNEVSKRFRE